MSFQIKDIILYGPSDEPRTLSFRLGALNVVTGASKTGKSSLISIVDYCLGSTSCSVAHGPIRSTVEWYGVRLALRDQEILVVRQAPKDGRGANSAVHFAIAAQVPIPPKSALSTNATSKSLVVLLSRAAGIADNLHVPPTGQTRDPLAATIRHARLLCFQPQDEIISRSHLFFHQGRQFVPQALRDTLPFFLGAVGDDHLVRSARLRRRRRELKELSTRLREVDSIRGDGSVRAGTLFAEAVDLGLAPHFDGDRSFDETVAALRRIGDRTVEDGPDFDATTHGAAYRRLTDERQELVRQYRRVDEDRRAAHALIADSGGYAAEAGEQIARLSSIGLLPDPDGDPVCPLCSISLNALPPDNLIVSRLKALQNDLANVDQEAPHLERLCRDLDEQADGVQEKLAANRGELEALQKSHQEVAEYRDQLARTAHVKGRISIYLEAVPENSDDADNLRRRAEDITAEIRSLESEIGADALEERLASVLSVVSHELTKIGVALDLEHASNPLRFSIKDLTVLADTPAGPISIEHMGAGANWVGYHLAVHLALHKLFVRRSRPVPRFLFVDQPSQVYFPSDRDTSDEDREAVLRMFRVLRDCTDELGGDFQIILTEHADETDAWYQEAVVERWRGGLALIPKEWIE